MPTTAGPSAVSLNEISQHYREIYSGGAKDENEKIIESIISLIQSSIHHKRPTKIFLDDVAKMIYRNFEFREIAIGLKSKRDGMFRYETLLGYRREAEEVYRKLAYTASDMVDARKYPMGLLVSRTSEYCLSEHKPFKAGEENSYNHPMLLKGARASPDDFVEGDYINLYFFGKKGEHIGWMELSAPRTGKAPSRSTMRWLEALTTIVSIIIQEREYA